MKKLKIFISGLCLIILNLFFISSVVIAAPADSNYGLSNVTNTATLLPTNTVEPSIAAVIGKIVSIVLSFLGAIFLVLIIYAGLLWMTARGNEQQVTKAKGIMRDAIIGLIIVLAAYAIVVLIGSLAA